MNKVQLVDLICELKCENIKEYENDVFLENKLKEVYQKLNIKEENISEALREITDQYDGNTNFSEWKYISLNFYMLYLLKNELKKSDDEILSVQQTKKLKICLQDVASIGILKNLHPKLPYFIKSENGNEDIILTYNVLKYTTYGLCYLLKQPNLRLLILPDSLQAILIALYQICFCPLKKPDKKPSSDGFLMTGEFYNKLLKEREFFKQVLDDLNKNIHPAIYIKETMIIFQTNSPMWFKKSISHTLTNIIRSKDGVKSIAAALLDGMTNDSTKTWKTYEIISKLLMSTVKFPDFKENIAKQIINLSDQTTEEYLIYERIFTHFTKNLYASDEELSKSIFVRRVISPFLYFTYKEHKFEENEDITARLVKNIRLLHSIFVENSGEIKHLPVDILTPVINILFRFYSVTNTDDFIVTNNELKDVLIGYIKTNPSETFKMFDSFLFQLDVTDILPFRKDIIVKIERASVIVNYSLQSVNYSTSESAESILKLLNNQTNLLVNLFGYLLHCLTQKDKYFNKCNEILLEGENEFMNEYIEKSLTVYKLLSDLPNNKNIQKHLTETPDEIINYIHDVLKKAIESRIHKTKDFESEGFQSVFTTVMILQELVINCKKKNLGKYKVLLDSLTELSCECTNNELKELIDGVLDGLENGMLKSTRYTVEDEKTALDKAIDDVCDPLLPVRGHGLITLAKLIEKKDKNTLERKQYVLNIFQQTLKNDDSFIYLSAISGLAAMADIFPDTVLNILCEEYSDFSRKDTEDGNEIRMKLGEVLVRVTKILGDMAPKYKPLLLNTFLNGAKDDDHLIRASSLSNLGEICRVLGYKLGSIVTEVLVCVHAIIATDKSIEARRAAVTVIRQLFVGLDSEMIAFLKEDILPIYRTLKQIYNNEKDDVMRLQAQLALEELNENMKNFVFPKQQINMEKKIIVMN